jgi:hypothetical protein
VDNAAIPLAQTADLVHHPMDKVDRGAGRGLGGEQGNINFHNTIHSDAKLRARW